MFHLTIPATVRVSVRSFTRLLPSCWIRPFYGFYTGNWNRIRSTHLPLLPHTRRVIRAAPDGSSSFQSLKLRPIKIMFPWATRFHRSEEHTSELQSPMYLVC